MSISGVEVELKKIYILGGDGCIDLAIFRKWPTMKTIFYIFRQVRKKKKFFRL